MTIFGGSLLILGGAIMGRFWRHEDPAPCICGILICGIGWMALL